MNKRIYDLEKHLYQWEQESFLQVYYDGHIEFWW